MNEKTTPPLAQLDAQTPRKTASATRIAAMASMRGLTIFLAFGLCCSCATRSKPQPPSVNLSGVSSNLTTISSGISNAGVRVGKYQTLAERIEAKAIVIDTYWESAR